MKNIKKIIIFAFCFCLLLVWSASAYSYKPTEEPESEAVYMVNAETGEVIYAKNENKSVDPANLTQVMTALVVLENCENLDEEVIAPQYVFNELYGKDFYTADIRAGEKLRIIDLVYAMMVQSSCEAASILADYIGKGDISVFVEMMNEKAKELEAEDTEFKTPHGMITPSKTTAFDFYKIYSYALKNERFVELTKTIRYTISANNMHSSDRTLVSLSYIIDHYTGGTYYYRHAITAKSSGTREAGRSLVTSANNGRVGYIIVSFGAPMYDESDVYIKNIGSFTDHQKLYNWAFDTLKVTKVLSKEDTITEVKVALSNDKDFVLLYPDRDYSVLLPNDVSAESIQYIKDVPEKINAPVKKGDVIGKLTLRLKNEDLVTVDLVAGDDVSADGVIRGAYLIGVVLTSPWFLGAVGVILLGVIALIIYARVHHKNKRKYKTVKRRRRF